MVLIGNKIYCDQVIVKFKEHIINFTNDFEPANCLNIKSNCSEIRDFFQTICKRQEIKSTDIQFYKAILNCGKDCIKVFSHRKGRTVGVPDLSRVYIIQFPKPLDIEIIIDNLLTLKDVEYAHQPVQTVDLSDNLPNDTEYLADKQWYFSKVNAENAWNISRGNTSIKIAVIDKNGVKRNHEDITQKYVGGDDDATLDTNHGTRVAGVAAATTNNDTGIACLGWENSLLTYRYRPELDYLREGLANDIKAAADDGAYIIVMSFNTSKDTVVQSKIRYKMWNYPLVEDAIEYADSLGVVIVAAAGNSAIYPQWDQIPYHAWPAEYENVIGVSGTYSNDNFIEGYNTSPSGTQLIDVVAPAWQIYTTSFTGDTDCYSYGYGTSYSTPLVAALASLIVSVNKTLSPEQIQSIITSTADKVGQYPYDENGWNDSLGYGRINAHDALLKTLDELDTLNSISSQATALNGSRKLIKTGDDLFLVYESGNQIYITESGNNGSTWSDPPTRLSDGEGQNKYPSITGNSSEQFVIWQRYTGYSNSYHHYELYFAKNTGPGWSTAKLTNLSDIQFSTETNPLPVITYETGDRLLVCAKTSNEIQYVYSNDYGSNWTNAATISGTSSSHQNLSLSMRPATPATSVLVYDDGSAIYYRNRYTSSWSGAVNVSSGSGTIDNCYPSV